MIAILGHILWEGSEINGNAYSYYGSHHERMEYVSISQIASYVSMANDLVNPEYYYDSKSVDQNDSISSSEDCSFGDKY